MISGLFERQPVLMYAGVVSAAAVALLAPLTMLDQTEILGINRWYKPIKFFASIAVFVWTVAVCLDLLRGREKEARRISWAMAAIFVIEMAIITGQAARGVRSHFNIETPVDGVLYAVMGAAIAANTLLAVWLAFLYFTTETDLPDAVLWGMRLGLVIFIFGSIEGGYMSSSTGHAVGAADGGPGLPFLSWSTVAGDLRVAHFVGLHAIQAIPLAALVFRAFAARWATMLTFVFAVLYFAFFNFVFIRALLAKPLVF